MRTAMIGGTAALLLAVGMVPAQASSAAAPLRLQEVEVVAGAPHADATYCDHIMIDCGYVGVHATFSGLSGRVSSQDSWEERQGYVTGSARVSRVYGCESAEGVRLGHLDTTVSENVRLGPRRGMTFTLPTDADTVPAEAYAFLEDAQPRNCPAGTQPMMYELRVQRVALTMNSSLRTVPSAEYRVKGRDRWQGAVPTPFGE
ncbi:hypothetical protein CLV92_102270 [Kineococcus xinjiangensis]|uniref:Uncharacterized protein n=1 Tax=Kineococcus xinjiangensis TaxID=512762 RepID=A0A2S6IV18_9ACTN|nr:hypothetical protein [Kineococcus xinjiangensis]PPK98117.1 hypothetical protein CLV92_102270 [Kineococcus xinjiangensis]